MPRSPGGLVEKEDQKFAVQARGGNDDGGAKVDVLIVSILLSQLIILERIVNGGPVAPLGHPHSPECPEEDEPPAACMRGPCSPTKEPDSRNQTPIITDIKRGDSAQTQLKRDGCDF